MIDPRAARPSVARVLMTLSLLLAGLAERAVMRVRRPWRTR